MRRPLYEYNKKTMKKSIVYVIAALCLCSCLFVQVIYAQPLAPLQTQSALESVSNFIEHRGLALGLYNKPTQTPANDAWNEEEAWLYEIEDGRMFWSEEEQAWMYETEDGILLLATDDGWVYYTEDGETLLFTDEGWVYETEDGISILSTDDGWVYETEDGVSILSTDEGWAYYTEDGEKLLSTDEGWVYYTEDGEKLLSTDEGWVSWTEDGVLILWDEEEQAWVSGTGDGRMLWDEEKQDWIPWGSQGLGGILGQDGDDQTFLYDDETAGSLWDSLTTHLLNVTKNSLYYAVKQIFPSIYT